MFIYYNPAIGNKITYHPVYQVLKIVMTLKGLNMKILYNKLLGPPNQESIVGKSKIFMLGPFNYLLTYLCRRVPLRGGTQGQSIF